MRRRVFFAAAAALVAGAVAVGVALAGGKTTGPDPYIVVAVTLTDTKLVLKPAASHGVLYVGFRVTNRGTRPHNFKIGVLKTPAVRPGKTAHLIAYFETYRKYAFACTLNCPPTARGMFLVGR